MTKLESMDESIEHWKAMIAWVKKQSPHDKPSVIAMAAAIDQAWLGEYCSICVTVCEDCPLGSLYGPCIYTNENNAWGAVSEATTWETWLVHAEKLLKQLERAKSVWIRKQKKPDIPRFVHRLIKANACGPAIKWLLKRQFRTVQEAWKACRNGTWMMWLIQKRPYRLRGRMYDDCFQAQCKEPNERRAAKIIRKYYPRAPKLP